MNLNFYRPLSREKREFRLARLKPAPHGEHDDHPIEVILEHATLNNPPTFTALSYTWGDNKDKTTILVNEIPTLTRRNLHAALYQLRKRALNDWIWIDAICINQDDDIERSWQVNEMRNIFALADQVYCWLGPAADDSDTLFHTLKRIAREVEDSGLMIDDITPIRGGMGRIGPMMFSTPKAQGARIALSKKLFTYEELNSKDGSDSRGAAALEKLLHRPFFSRVWIIQEFSLAKQCQFICGQSSLDVRVFDVATKAIELSAWYWRRSSSKTSSRDNNFFFPFDWTYMRSKPLEIRQEIACGSLPDLQEIVLIRTACPQRPLYAASDPRDIIFGLLGCAADAESLGLQADYSKPVDQVFAEVTKAFIRQRKRYQLGHCSFQKDMLGLPSWVPDWKRLGEFGGLHRSINCSVFFAADEGLVDALNGVYPESWKILRACGWYVDVVTAVMKPAKRESLSLYSSPYLSSGNQMRWLLDIIEFFQLDSSGQADEAAVWRTVVMDQQRQGERTTPVWQDLAPRAFHGPPLMVEELTPNQLEFVEHFTRDGTVEGFKNRCLDWMKVSCRFRTLFKTTSGKIGLGPEVMLAGDIVTILHGNDTPIILRPKTDQHHLYVGDAYVHAIMDGEFAATEPKLRYFELI
ncbi:heterokaryon incompatibility protein-domain-containing protein [Xylaria curta]|nr:heterokaryon incompatibility protein-domain-containing protein [Xylaria curta]